ncbi:multiheme c-type cytochrome [Magnetofaba australis]|uniref:Putative cytochrome b subunit of formate dehydrogenase n=1 Tax=Magnetofaba australis IT-1 TaxID=1434232 RepID=A0A1Y2K8A3_9PROT|nr:cytochrome C [Magnetofaba australis]OSM06980.1 putative cytochrome b subunit of formate dehydrogenase [Magnetofaba australis IT-1]
MNRFFKILRWSSLALVMGLSLFATPSAQANNAEEMAAAKVEIPEEVRKANKSCYKCHGDEDEKTYEMDDGSEKFIFVEPEPFDHSVHGKQECKGCHANVELERGEHEENLPITVGCVDCHMKNWEEAKKNGSANKERLAVVVTQIESYMHSVHAQPKRGDQSKTNAACKDCHNAHNVGALGSEVKAERRVQMADICGACHEKQKEQYKTSIHGVELLEKGNNKSAVCADCHTTHNIASPDDDQVKLTITKSCGNCHEKSYETYMHSYHGQVNRLGYAHTAKCYDCHGSHDLKAVKDPTSKVHINNRLKTCNECHKDAPEGFLGFHAHGDPNDFEKYPGIYITAKFMTALIIGVFLFFWTHVLLWFYREYQDRKQGKGYFVDHANPANETIYVRRFTAWWRTIHLLFAVSTMTLVMTGSTLLFSHTPWAPIVMDMLGGPKVEAIIHRTAAVTWLTVFFLHFLTAVYNITKAGKKFRWFGPTSMIPNWQDLKDVIAMFKWFFGFAERPTFDRWAYWQKFDYWAPFWGAAVIGLSGVMLFAPTVTAKFLPGFMFNIATIVHAEEALLATMFLFTVHFFNAHFRPDRFPMSTTIFTGAIPLEEFKHEHAREYERLKASGELEKHLVSKPSKLVARGSKLLATILILAGLTLLTLVTWGYVSSW